MINSQIFTRGNKQYTANWGTDEGGRFQLWIDEADLHESTQQPVRHIPEQIGIDFDITQGKGSLSSIRTRWKKVLISNSGVPIAGTGGPEGMSTNKTDLTGFASIFGDAFQKFMVNGLVRSIFGHNYQPLFDAQGGVIPDTSYDTTLAPTNDYQTHNADGTAIV
jgi:hypothetical protein